MKEIINQYMFCNKISKQIRDRTFSRMVYTCGNRIAELLNYKNHMQLKNITLICYKSKGIIFDKIQQMSDIEYRKNAYICLMICYSMLIKLTDSILQKEEERDKIKYTDRVLVT